MTKGQAASHQTWHIAEINIARLRLPLSDPAMASFVSQLDAINRLAEESPGFVWRLKADDGSASTYVRFSEDERIVVNMSVWTSIDALHEYVYRSRHGTALADRHRWFEPLGSLPLALWWVPAGHLPSLEEGRSRLSLLTRAGPTPDAFTFKQRFAPAAADVSRTGLASVRPAP